MEEKDLTIHKSPKRKRDEAGHIEGGSLTPATIPFRSIKHEGICIRENASERSRDSSQVEVAGRLEGLDIDATPASRHDNMREIHGETIPEVEAPIDTSDNRSMDVSTTDDGAVMEESKLKNEEEAEGKRIAKGIFQPSINEFFPVSTIQPPEASHPSNRKSPPLLVDSDEDPLTWHESEITGHEPTDPNDDGYGMNGIGFKPSPAVAWDRSQRRKNQVAEWERREARDARDRRRERRDGIISDMKAPTENANQKRVKFNT